MYQVDYYKNEFLKHIIVQMLILDSILKLGILMTLGFINIQLIYYNNY